MATKKFCNQLLQGIQDEQDAQQFYDKLIAAAPNKSAKDMIRNIAKDEQQHFKNFLTMFDDFCSDTMKKPNPNRQELHTGQKAPTTGTYEFVEFFGMCRNQRQPTENQSEIPLEAGERFPPIGRCGAVFQLKNNPGTD